MNWKWNNMSALLFLLPLLLPWQSAQAESKRIEVYPLDQQYWDTQQGETLGEIVEQLLPNNPRMQKNLIKDIVALNPRIFKDGNPDHMPANTRLWLPSHLTKPDTVVNQSHTTVESFPWGNIKRPKR